MSNPSPPVIQLGASIAVATTTELGTLDPSHLGLGTQVMVTADGSIWLLSKSTATVGAGVVAVSGVTGWRWLEQGGTTGFVTLAELADTTITSGATLIGVNANGGMFSEPDLQHVLQEDVVLKANLAATDGSGGASLVGVQNTGGYWANSHALETILQTIGSGLFSLGAAGKLELDVADATTATTSVVKLTTHTTSGVPAPGFGSIDKQQLKNAAGTLKDASQFVTRWTVATGGSERSSLDIGVTLGGTMTTVASFSGGGGADASLNLPTANTSEQAILLTSAGNQSIYKTGSGNFAMGADASLSFVAGSSTGLLMNNPNPGQPTDIRLATSSDLGNTAIQGFVFMPVSTTTGAPSGVPAQLTGAWANSQPMFINRADKKLWCYFSSGGWKSVLFI